MERPFSVFNLGDFSADKNFKDSRFFEVTANPQPSYDEMFPFTMQDDPREMFDLYLLDYSHDIDTVSFLTDVANDPTLRFVGVHGMILLVESFYGFIPTNKNIVSPAYQFTRSYLVPGTENKAQIPYFHFGSHDVKLLVKYSDSRTSELSDPDEELILIGKICN